MKSYKTPCSTLDIKDIKLFFISLEEFKASNSINSVSAIYDDIESKRIAANYIETKNMPKEEVTTFTDLCDTPPEKLHKPWHFEITFKRPSTANLRKWFWLPQGRLANRCACDLSFNTLSEASSGCEKLSKLAVVSPFNIMRKDILEQDKIYQEIFASQNNGVCHRVGGV
jgi:hypothetical protein